MLTSEQIAAIYKHCEHCGMIAELQSPEHADEQAVMSQADALEVFASLADALIERDRYLNAFGPHCAIDESVVEVAEQIAAEYADNAIIPRTRYEALLDAERIAWALTVGLRMATTCDPSAWLVRIPSKHDAHVLAWVCCVRREHNGAHESYEMPGRHVLPALTDEARACIDAARKESET